jgi:hypothetical protein
LGDIDADGLLEIVAGAGYNKEFYVFNGDGSIVPGYPKLLNDEVWASPAIADLDKDGCLEMLIGEGNNLKLFKGEQGYVDLQSWSQFSHDMRRTGNYNSQCSNGVYVGECTDLKPLYCDYNQEIANNCQKCGCSTLKGICQPDGSCKKQLEKPKIKQPL